MISDLSSNWFCEGTIDFELKQYVLLAYLQFVESDFKQKKLYKTMTDLISHHYKLLSFKHHTEHLEDGFPKELVGFGVNKQKVLEYRNKAKTNKEIEEIKEIVDYALYEIGFKIEEGKEIYDSVGSKVFFDEVGLIPLHKDEGYLIIYYQNVYKVYQYKKALLFSDNEKYSGLNLRWWSQHEHSISTSFDSIKANLLKAPLAEMPAVFGVEFPMVSFPYEETVLPVIKREFIVHLSKGKSN